MIMAKKNNKKAKETIFTSLITIVGVFVMMLKTNWFLTLIIVAIVPPAAAIALSIMKISKRQEEEPIKKWDYLVLVCNSLWTFYILLR